MAAGADPAAGDAVPLTERHLPTVVNAPGTWSTRYGVDGPVAALGIATRTRAVNISETRTSMAIFAVSAVDGRSSWLRLPGFSLDRWGYSGGVAVSPDGQWIGWVRPARSGGRGLSARVAGWSVLDTATGDVRDLEVPGFPSVRAAMADLAFSGDSRHLLTSYETPGQPKPKPEAKGERTGVHQLVAWDVEDGTPTVLEEPGPYWLPNLGSAPTGVVWARKQQVFRADPRTGVRTVLTLPRDVITAAWSPDDTSFAYIGRPSANSKGPWRVYAGRTVAEARDQAFALPSGTRPRQLLGWRDATHVVVGELARLRARGRHRHR